MAATVDTDELEAKVKDMYRHVAEEPEGDYHFELGRGLAISSATRPRSWGTFPRGRSSRSPASATSSTWPSCSRASR